MGLEDTGKIIFTIFMPVSSMDNLSKGKKKKNIQVDRSFEFLLIITLNVNSHVKSHSIFQNALRESLFIAEHKFVNDPSQSIMSGSIC